MKVKIKKGKNVFLNTAFSYICVLVFMSQKKLKMNSVYKHFMHPSIDGVLTINIDSTK